MLGLGLHGPGSLQDVPESFIMDVFNADSGHGCSQVTFVVLSLGLSGVGCSAGSVTTFFGLVLAPVRVMGTPVPLGAGHSLGVW